MTSTVTRKAHALRVIALLLGVLTVLLGLAALAQTPRPGLPEGKTSVVPWSPNLSALQNRLQTKRIRSGPEDANPPLFLPAVTYHSGGYDLSLTVADVNGDGRSDLVMADYDGSVDVLLGNGDGTFQMAAIYSSGGSAPYSVAVADLNGDAKPDLAVANFQSNNVGVLLGNGDGTFQSAVSYPSSNSDGSCPDFVALADLNGDGKPDMVVLNWCGANFLTKQASVLIGNGDGTFQPAVDYSTGGEIPASLAVADLNGDGKSDLLIVNGWASLQDISHGSVGVLLGNGNGTFQPPVALDSGGSLAASIAVADINGDGNADAVVSHCGPTGSEACLNYGNPPGIGVISVLLGSGMGSFSSPVTFSAGVTGASSVAIADVNGDSDRDIVVSSCGSSSCDNAVGVLLGNGDGTFDSSVIFGSGGYGAAAVVIGDVNGDIRPDLLVATCDTWSCSSGTAAVLLNNTGSHSATTTMLMSSWNPAPHGKVVTFTATVTSQDGGPVTGTVVFQDGGVTIATAPLANNQAVYSTKYGKSSPHPITATYSGDLHNLGIVSATLVEYISSVSTKTVLASSVSPSHVGQPVTFTATVMSKKGPIPEGELVTFFDGITALGSVPLLGGTAAFTTSGLSAKTHTIKARYLGDATFMPSTGTITQVVNAYSTTTTLTSNPNPSNFGAKVTLRAHVTSLGPTPTGKVRFLDGTTTLGSATLSGGVAKLAKSKLAVGTHPITAQYMGDAASAKSTSGVVNQVAINVVVAARSLSMRRERTPCLQLRRNLDYVAFQITHLEISGALAILLNLGNSHSAGDQEFSGFFQV